MHLAENNLINALSNLDSTNDDSKLKELFIKYIDEYFKEAKVNNNFFRIFLEKECKEYIETREEVINDLYNLVKNEIDNIVKNEDKSKYIDKFNHLLMNMLYKMNTQSAIDYLKYQQKRYKDGLIDTFDAYLIEAGLRLIIEDIVYKYLEDNPNIKIGKRSKLTNGTEDATSNLITIVHERILIHIYLIYEQNQKDIEKLLNTMILEEVTQATTSSFLPKNFVKNLKENGIEDADVYTQLSDFINARYYSYFSEMLSETEVEINKDKAIEYLINVFNDAISIQNEAEKECANNPDYQPIIYKSGKKEYITGYIKKEYTQKDKILIDVYRSNGNKISKLDSLVITTRINSKQNCDHYLYDGKDVNNRNKIGIYHKYIRYDFMKNEKTFAAFMQDEIRGYLKPKEKYSFSLDDPNKNYENTIAGKFSMDKELEKLGKVKGIRQQLETYFKAAINVTLNKGKTGNHAYKIVCYLYDIIFNRFENGALKHAPKNIYDEYSEYTSMDMHVDVKEKNNNTCQKICGFVLTDQDYTPIQFDLENHTYGNKTIDQLTDKGNKNVKIDSKHDTIGNWIQKVETNLKPFRQKLESLKEGITNG